jgi:hypothetical protein
MTTEIERMLPLYEGKMIHHYDHRWATYEPDGSTRDVTLAEKQDPTFVVLPRYWVRESVVGDRLADRWDRDWLLGWRDICRSTDERTMIASIDGGGASPEGGTLLAMPALSLLAPLVLAVWNSFAFDFVARQKVGGTHLKYFTVRQLPVPTPASFGQPTPWAPGERVGEWVQRRVVWLVTDAVDMTAFAVDYGSDVGNDRWQAMRRIVRAELDAAMFHLYGIVRDDVDYVLETFPIVKRKDLATHGEYLTKRLILEIYDQMAVAITTNKAYVSEFDQSNSP